MSKRLKCLLLVIVVLPLAGWQVHAQSGFSVLHSFLNSVNDGENPEGQPLLIGGTNLVGLAYNGGANGAGALFQVSTNGSGFTLLYSFEGDLNGANPFGLLAASGNSFYGMTFNGGINDGGVIYRVRTNGSNYAVLHTFNGGSTDGQFPFGSLIVTGSTVFGMTANGGTNGAGVVFKMTTNSLNFAILHSFTGGVDGGSPSEGVILAGTNLYGTTYFGGSNSAGTVFTVGTNGGNLSVLHHFGGGTNDGANPSGPLTLVGSSLYGITTEGGTNNVGTVFTIGTNGAGYAILHSFSGGTLDGASPQFGPLVANGNLLYGSTRNGGTANVGLVFQIATDGTGFAVLNSFGATATDSTFPVYPPIFVNSNFYGMATDGGSNNLGTVYGPGLSNIITIISSGGPTQVCAVVPSANGAGQAGVSIGNVIAGQLYTYQASGCIGRNLDGTTDDPDGNEYNNNCTVPLTPNLGPGGPFFKCPGLIEFSLVGKFADGSCVQLGQNTNQDGYFIPPVSGPMTLFFNDDNYFDNSGTFQACITPLLLSNVCQTVPATADSGVDFGKVYAGIQYTVTASGSAAYDCPGGLYVDPNGQPYGAAFVGATNQHFTCATLYPFSLVGELNGNCIQLGSSASFVAPVTGELFLLMNDVLSGFFNNCGSWNVCLEPVGSFRITAITTVGNDILLNWNTSAGKTNYVQVYPGDVNGSYNSNGFVDLSGPIIVPGAFEVSTNYLEINGARHTPSRYYRVRLVQP